MDSQTLFLLHIMDGYSFRNAMGIIKSEIDEATLVLSPTSVSISFLNTSKCAVHNLTLRPEEFTIYKYNITDDNKEPLKEFPIGFKTTEMFNTTKGIGRRDGIRIYWITGDNKINVQPIKTSAKDPGRASANFVKILTIEHMRYNIGQQQPEPNIRVQAKDFADICSQASNSKCSALEVIGYPSAVTFKGILPNGTEAFISKFTSQIQVATKNMVGKISNIDEIDDLLSDLKLADNQDDIGVTLNIIRDDDQIKIKIPIATTKALSKIHNISAPGTMIRFFFAKGLVKIESPIGTYGTYTIGLRNVSGSV